MKVLVDLFIFAFVAVTLQEQVFSDLIKMWMEIHKPNQQECVAETNVEIRLFERMLFHGEFVDNRALKCYVKCVFLKEGTINAAGEVQPEILKQKLNITDEALLEEAAQQCMAIELDDVCDKIYNIGKCIYQLCQSTLKP